MTNATDYTDAEAAPEPDADSGDTGDAGDADEGRSSDDRTHLDGVDDGCGCAEVWEHLSEQREAGASD